MGNNEFSFYKQLIVDVSRDLVQKGYLSATGGNLSVRVSGQPGFVITPSNYDYIKMVPDDICVLDFALHPLDGHRTPSVESRMHAAIYQVRPDVNAIIHTHQVYPSTLAIIGRPIPALFDEQVRFLGGEVKIIPYAPSGTDGLKNAIASHVQDGNNAFIMANHGALLFGIDMERAVHNIAVLEKCALAYLLALCTDNEVTTIPPEARDLALTRLHEDQERYADLNQK